MRKRIVALLAVCGLAASFVGCGVMPDTAVMAPLVLHQKNPVAVGNTTEVQAEKTGTARAQGILIFSYGDASIKKAMQDGNITQIHHVDSETLNVLGIYSEYIVKVHGE
jgi:hypothetical protein